MPSLPEPTREPVDRLVPLRVVAPGAALALAVALLFRVDAWRTVARRFVACADLPATPCARLRCAPSAAARVKDRPHSGQTNWPLGALLIAGPDRVAVARFFAAGVLFDVAIGSFLSR